MEFFPAAVAYKGAEVEVPGFWSPPWTLSHRKGVQLACGSDAGELLFREDSTKKIHCFGPVSTGEPFGAAFNSQLTSEVSGIPE